MAALSYFIVDYLLPPRWTDPGDGREIRSLGVFFAAIVGLGAGLVIGHAAEYYTAEARTAARRIGEASQTGPATNIVRGLATGMASTTLPLACIAVAVVLAYRSAGLYGIAVGALGMLSTTGIRLAVDACGSIAASAGGIAELSELPEEVRDRTEQLDAAGSTTTAVGKGFAIASAALVGLALLSAFRTTVSPRIPIALDVSDPVVMVGLFVGGMLPFLFASMSMTGAGETAGTGKDDVRRPLRETIAMGFLAVTVPVLAGFASVELLGGILAGVTVSGVLLATFMSNAGVAWYNAKRSIEGGAFGGKGSDAHRAAVVGERVGDPLKDRSGPSLNVLVKLTSVVALVIAPLLRSFHGID
jgi:K(+)-stimulated pyrophosphate-energized sodium pump